MTGHYFANFPVSLSFTSLHHPFWCITSIYAVFQSLLVVLPVSLLWVTSIFAQYSMFRMLPACLIPLSPSYFGARLRNDYYLFPRHRLALKTCSHNEIYGHVFVETRNNAQTYNPVQTQSTEPEDIPMVCETWSQWHSTRGRWHLSGNGWDNWTPRPELGCSP